MTSSESITANFLNNGICYSRFILMNMIFSYVLENTILFKKIWARRILLIVKDSVLGVDMKTPN